MADVLGNGYRGPGHVAMKEVILGHQVQGHRHRGGLSDGHVCLRASLPEKICHLTAEGKEAVQRAAGNVEVSFKQVKSAGRLSSELCRTSQDQVRRPRHTG